MYINQYNKTFYGQLHLYKEWFTSLSIVVLLACVAISVRAQGGFNSGSTGADGALDLSVDRPGCPASQNLCTLQLPPNGIFNFTIVNIPAGKTLKFNRNANNTPVIMLAQGNVVISGSIDIGGVSAAIPSQDPTFGTGGDGGPGGYKGGMGGFPISTNLSSGISGDGPGGGGGARQIDPFAAAGGGGGYTTAGQTHPQPGSGQGGPIYGAATLVALFGGSGGGGGAGGNGRGRGGGGGGGAILIASSGSISFGGQTVAVIDARGGNGDGGGSGGAIRLVANVITGGATLRVDGQGANTIGSPGRIRVEAYDYSSFNPSILANNVPAATSFALPPPTPPPFMPQGSASLVIASVAGQSPPAIPRGSLQGAPDMTLPTTQTNPVPIVIQGSNIPVGTTVQVTVTPENGARTTVPGVLQGTPTSTSVTVDVTLPTAMQSVISAAATFDITTSSAKPMFINGERVEKVEVKASFGGASELTYITKSGKRVPAPK